MGTFFDICFSWANIIKIKIFYFYIKLDKRVLKYWHPSFAELSLHKESAVVIYSFERVREREVPSQ